MTVYLTSFFKTRELPEGVEVFSGAVYQPKGYTLPKCDFADIRDEHGKWIRPRNFLDAADPAQAYFAAMQTHFAKREREIAYFCAEHPNVAICCWCPYDRAAKRQLEEFGTFICHTGPLGAVLENFGYDVLYDEDRLKMYGP